MRGYSQKVINDNKKARPVTPGIKLGKLCIKLMYPAADIAKKLSTSRQCVYNWFCGKCTPSKNNIDKINQLIKELTAEYK
jgi:NADH:ubiquinone oxidoreductase subunit F (NADH-binding)|tara:strand:+ start:1286 stop:1525 length:240 start_codon:yes stop_codon:yes gene_type:complete